MFVNFLAFNYICLRLLQEHLTSEMILKFLLM